LHQLCVTVSTAWSNETGKEKDILTLKAASHTEMQNDGCSTYVDGFTFNTTKQNICKSQNKNTTNMTTTFTIEHDKF